MNVLIVDDKRAARETLADILRDLGLSEIEEAASLEEARRVIERRPIDVALVDIRLSDDIRNRDGLTLVKELAERTTTVPVCVSTLGEVADIRVAMRHGARDYILKDGLSEETVAPLLNHLRTSRRLESEVQQLRARHAPGGLRGLIGTSTAMERLRKNIGKVALSDRPVLILGPTGAGKEEVARAVHALGAHPEAPQFSVNCANFKDTLIESELFGHERGAFTGAVHSKHGHLAAVGRGTLFLDEVAELSPATQASLLRVLETGRYRPLSSSVERVFEGRIIAATHADLLDRVSKGAFREDLYYRLNVAVLRVPSLGERLEDIPALVAHFLKGQRRELRFSQGAIDALVARLWPGNVRELRNEIDRVAIFADVDDITPEVLSEVSQIPVPTAQDTFTRLARIALQSDAPNKLKAFARSIAYEALNDTGGNRTLAAQRVGMHRKAFARLLQKYPDASPEEDGSPEEEVDDDEP